MFTPGRRSDIVLFGVRRPRKTTGGSAADAKWRWRHASADQFVLRCSSSSRIKTETRPASVAKGNDDIKASSRNISSSSYFSYKLAASRPQRLARSLICLDSCFYFCVPRRGFAPPFFCFFASSPAVITWRNMPSEKSFKQRRTYGTCLVFYRHFLTYTRRICFLLVLSTQTESPVLWI